MPTKPAETDLRVREHFDGQMELYVDRHRPKHIAICAERMRLFGQSMHVEHTRPLRLLDVGCGAGYLCDAFLSEFPNAQAVGIDVSTGMLARNAADRRKLLLVADARAIPFAEGKFDVVNFDTVLHHVIDPGGYGKTIAGIGELLHSLQRHMPADGTIMIREIFHEFRLWRSLGCRMLYYLTCTQLPGPVAGLIRKAGIKTANVGVCFLTRGQWRRVFRASGLRIVAANEVPWKSPLRFLGISSGETYYYLQAERCE